MSACWIQRWSLRPDLVADGEAPVQAGPGGSGGASDRPGDPGAGWPLERHGPWNLAMRRLPIVVEQTTA